MCIHTGQLDAAQQSWAVNGCHWLDSQWLGSWPSPVLTGPQVLWRQCHVRGEDSAFLWPLSLDEASAMVLLWAPHLAFPGWRPLLSQGGSLRVSPQGVRCPGLLQLRLQLSGEQIPPLSSTLRPSEWGSLPVFLPIGASQGRAGLVGLGSRDV